MTKYFARKPHPARRARIATAVMSSTTFLMIISSFAWNTHTAELAASTTPITPEVPANPATAVVETPAPVAPAPVTPTVATAPAATTPSPAATPAKKKKKKVVAATPAAPAAPTTQAAVPAAPAVQPVVYTCVSPNTGYNKRPKGQSCPAGYVLTQK